MTLFHIYSLPYKDYRLLISRLLQVPGEKIYESWDCPKIKAISNHDPCEHDEIAIYKGETANVLKKTNDGKGRLNLQTLIL